MHLQTMGILDPVQWAGKISEIGEPVRSLIFPNDDVVICDRYRASLMELVLGSASIDEGLACQLVCTWAAADFFHTISLANLK